MTVKYTIDEAAFRAEVLNSPAMVAHCRAIAENAHAIADATAPFDANDPDGIHYRDQFEVSSGTNGGIHNDRAFGRLENNDVSYDRNGTPFSVAAAVEFGTARTSAHHTIRNAMNAAAGQ